MLCRDFYECALQRHRKYSCLVCRCDCLRLQRGEAGSWEPGGFAQMLIFSVLLLSLSHQMEGTRSLISPWLLLLLLLFSFCQSVITMITPTQASFEPQWTPLSVEKEFLIMMWMKPSYAPLIGFPNPRLTNIRQLRWEWRAHNSSSHWHSCCN